MNTDIKQTDFEFLCDLFQISVPPEDLYSDYILFHFPSLLQKFCETDSYEYENLVIELSEIPDEYYFSRYIILHYIDTVNQSISKWKEKFVDLASEYIILFFKVYKHHFKNNLIKNI